MYEVNHLDKVIELKDIPQSSIGAPIPIVLAGEHDVLITYYLQDTPDDWDGTSIKIVDSDTEDEPVAIDVIAEFENQYNQTVVTKDIDLSRLFTGSFTHNNLDLALKSVTIPLNLGYSKSGKSILLKRE